MKVLVVGSGGREHALAWKLAQSPKVQVVYVAPGNGGTALDKRLQNVPLTDPEVIAAFAEREGVAFTVVGPEAPLAAGIVDIFRAKGLRIFGPTQAAAQLESSKDFAKAFMQRHGIPTAAYQTFADAAQAHAYIDAQGAPIVIKADGLAAGKGVVVAMTLEEAHQAVDMMLDGNKLGDAGARVVIEEFLEGEEASFIVLVDGKNVLALATSQDHKRLLDADVGPNTGGMGAYSPAPVVTPALHARALREIILPTVRGMEKDGIPYTGFLYAGLMIDQDGNPRTLEFNCRMGDPETQPILARLKTDLVDVMEAAVSGKLDSIELDWDRRTALGVVMAAHGYPDDPRKGDAITGIPAETDDSVTFHAGTTLKDGTLLTSGGRVLCVVGLADTVKAAQRAAYAAVEQIRFDGMQYRTDIGYRAIKR
ncbi:phosphoribosylamine--glycine ligase [Cupriavidus taiwanensis]|uniref:phosphoribosylamine--glycine ligase n=1 Tax=Cupriavidus taiwanensis TaxID=164546 RepID=UPI000E101BCB|nr:phosphoribosylamine--glycine ligase [Cupriavidus taiwanensis]SOY56276.1 phosphoribosylglycinamide synthetase (GAR synthetase) [Cupriavidus taiwanensis]SOY56950.1 phosphoribosylglycinamide synthetase (GAR synthetase) [Cupriavidus taiwanensis]SOY90967.1 phosphoribosylglycinamide synthetase (GAR synthetase) [Cupriavidus taiwanensis]SOZ63778.1 phosphoribosylglycinamide synthetase (GAR synthetase) [Cupriavidus taiwanensis]SOZ82755.1 phosphoribosylglycinamide synthetase (GAR synthetase) [Cupriavi